MQPRHLPLALTAILMLGCTGSTTEPATSAIAAPGAAAAAVGGPVHSVQIGGPDVCSGFGAQPGCDANFSLNAMLRADGSVTGQWIDRFSQNFGGGGLFVTVDCLEVDGNRAWIGGYTSGPDGTPGLRAVTYAEDRGTSYALERDDGFLTLYGLDDFGLSTDCHDRPFQFTLNVPQGQVVIR